MKNIILVGIFLVIVNSISLFGNRPPSPDDVPPEFFRFDRVFGDELEFRSNLIRIDMNPKLPFDLFEASITKNSNELYMYIVLISNSYMSYDYVFFKQKTDKEIVYKYFKERWLYLIDGIEKGFIHFEESIFRSDESWTVFGVELTSSEGSRFGNSHYATRRLSALKGIFENIENPRPEWSETEQGRKALEKEETK